MTPTLRNRLTDAAIAGGLGLAYVVSLVKTTRDLGYARDEGFYFQAATSYGRWFELLYRDPKAALARRAVDGAWSANHEHPSLMKGLFALSNLLQQKTHIFAEEGTSYRFPAILVAGLLVALIYVWGREARGRFAGIAAAVLFAAMPRVFFQAHLACFDIPIVAMWTATAYAYWKARRSGGVLWPVLTGIAFGLALDTKHNAWFLPFAIGAHTAISYVWASWLDVRGRPTARRDLGRAAAALLAMATIGPLVFWALWPWIWHDTIARLGAYGAFHLHHEYYNMEFFGETYFKPPMPRLYVWVMTLATVPIVTLVLFASGLVLRIRTHVRRLAPFDSSSTDLLWLLGIGVNYAVWLSTNTPIFGGTKHWMTAYPFLALFAGSALASSAAILRREIARVRRALGALAFARSKWLPPVALGALALSAPIVETAHSHPWGLSSYTPLVGGASGAATLGFNRTFWGYTTGAMVDYLDTAAPRNASIYIHDTASPSWDMLLRDGRLRRDLRAASSIAHADFGLYHHEMHMEGQEYQNWVAFGSDRPDAIGGLDGVPVILVYRRR